MDRKKREGRMFVIFFFLAAAVTFVGVFLLFYDGIGYSWWAAVILDAVCFGIVVLFSSPRKVFQELRQAWSGQEQDG